MADELQDGSEVIDFQEDYLTEDELVNKRNTKLHVNSISSIKAILCSA